MLGTRNESLQAIHWWRCMLPTGQRPRVRTQCWMLCWIGRRHRNRQIQGCFWQNMPPSKKVNWSYGINRISNSPESLVPMPNTQRWNWRLPALCSSQGTLCCHSEWVPLRCRPSRVWPHAVLVVRMLLVARNDQPGAEILRSCTHCLQHEGNLSKAPLHPIVSTAPMDLLHVDFTSIEMTMELNRCLRLWTSWCSRTVSGNTLWCMWPLIRPQRLLPSFIPGLHLNLWGCG